MTTHTVEVVEILPIGDAVIQFTPEQIADLGWAEGDTIEITMNEATNQVSLRKKAE